MPWKQVWGVGGLLLAGVAVSPGQQSSVSDDAGRVTALELAWNHAIEAKDAAALDLLLGDTLVAIDSDGSIANKSEYLASIKDPNYQPTQAVNEQTNVQVYGDTAVALGVFRVKGTEKKKAFVHRQRTIDTWVKQNGTWKCVSAVAVEITAKPAID